MSPQSEVKRAAMLACSPYFDTRKTGSDALNLPQAVQAIPPMRAVIATLFIFIKHRILSGGIETTFQISPGAFSNEIDASPSSWPGLSSQVGFTRLATLLRAQLGQARVAVPSMSLLRHERRGCPALRFTLGPAGGRTRVPGMTTERPSQPSEKRSICCFPHRIL